ncbi:phosphotransferase [Microlunatus sp. GCM10028923]|uniref:phosphotransferase n=1 Tax=Microlunatus sp. GCM10028923 TaxID=3273400 RepID=UPI0036172754
MAFPIALWASFLRDRGVDVSEIRVSRFDRGEVNDNWRIDSGSDVWVLRHYRLTADAAELNCELAAVDRLAQAGFPTPAPVPAVRVAGEHRLWELVDGRPAALFVFVPGQHPPERDGGYGSMDLELGQDAARLAARMHQILHGQQLPGSRHPTRDPWRQVGAFLTSPLANNDLFSPLIPPLRELHSRLAEIYSVPAPAPQAGLIHNDITPANLLLDTHGQIVAVLDFDDSAQTFLAYDLGSIVSTFGKDQHRRIDLDRIVALVEAYTSVRDLTPGERTLLPDLLAAHAAAQGIHVLGNWLSAGRDIGGPMESHSAQEFLDLVETRSTLRRLT